MKLKWVASIIDSSIPTIPNPSVELEQYSTPGRIAARVAYEAVMSCSVDAVYADLGSGTCRLAAALALLGAARIVAVEADERLCPICMDASTALGVGNAIQPVCGRIDETSGPLAPGTVDAVVMNPPYGVHKRGADRMFLEYSFKLRPHLVLAIVKSGNLAFHARLASKYGYRASLLWEDSLEIPASMPHHRSRIRRVRVDVIAFSRADEERYGYAR